MAQDGDALRQGWEYVTAAHQDTATIESTAMISGHGSIDGLTWSAILDPVYEEQLRHGMGSAPSPPPFWPVTVVALTAWPEAVSRHTRDA